MSDPSKGVSDVGFVYGGAAFVFLALLLWRFHKPPTTFGSASWLTVFQAFENGLFQKGGLIVGDFAGLLPVYYDGTHALTYGAAGSGKGTTVIIPNLLQYPFIFLNDPGGENTAVAIKQWRKRGFETFVINPFGEHTGEPWLLPSHAFNPFDFIDPASDTFLADSKLLAEILTPRSPSEADKNRFFTERAEAILHGLLVHAVTAEPPERRNLGTLYEYVHLDPKGWDKLLAAMKANQAGDGLVRAVANDLQRTEAQAPEEFSAVFSTTQQNLQWLADLKSRQAVSRSEVDFDALKGRKKGQRGAVIAVVMPLRYNETHKAIPRLAMQCAVWAMQRQPMARQKVLFEIDEAASLGRLERLPQWFAELRKYRVQWSLHFQDVNQPKTLYGEGWQTFQGNAGLKRFVGVRDPKTAREAAELYGPGTIWVRSRNMGGGGTISQTSREPRLPSELMRLRDDQMVALIDNLQPALLKKTPYWERPEFAGCYHPNPYVGGLARASAETGFKVLWGKLVYAAAWWLTPHPLAAFLILAFAAFGMVPLFYGGP